jgi:hypothetical protein
MENPSFSVNFEEMFHEAARELDAEIKDAGGRTVFFMLWGMQGHGPNVTTDNQAQAYNKIGAELDAMVVPVGLAWERALTQRPTLPVVGDIAHEELATIQGTYLTACVFYATLLGQSPGGLSYTPDGISDEEREFLQRMAWETVQEYQQPAQALRTS